MLPAAGYPGTGHYELQLDREVQGKCIGKCTNTVCMGTVLYTVCMGTVLRIYCMHGHCSIHYICVWMVFSICLKVYVQVLYVYPLRSWFSWSVLYVYMVYLLFVPCTYLSRVHSILIMFSQYPLLWSPLSRIFKRVPTNTQPIRVTSLMRRNRMETFQLMWSWPANLVRQQLCFGSLQPLAPW